MTQEIERRLLHLRENLVNNAINASRIKDLLLKYYPVGTKIVITKDYYRIEEPKEE